MSTKSREVIWGSRISGAKIHARHAREEARKAIRAADRAEAEAWSVRMEGYGGPAQPSPTIGQCLNGGLSWLEVECNRCKTRASLPLDTPPPARHAAVETGSVAKVPLLPQGPHRTAGAHGNRLLSGAWGSRDSP
jgi:hypothetical protein